MTFSRFKKVLQQKLPYPIIELPTSSLRRKGMPYFTFSPFQDTEDNYIRLANSNDFYIKKQETIRKINTLDLTNPLCVNNQWTYAIQNYQKIDQADNIKRMIDALCLEFFPNLSKQEIEITFPITLKTFFRKNFFPYRLNPDVMEKRYQARLPLPGEHYYLKVRMKHQKGWLNIVDFVLVNFDQKNLSSQLDSIWVEDLIDLIEEDKTYIFDEKKYVSLQKIVRSISEDKRDQHILLNDFRLIQKMLSLGIEPSSKGSGNDLKRKIRSFYFYNVFYLKLDLDGIKAWLDQMPPSAFHTNISRQILLSTLEKIDREYKKSVKDYWCNNYGRKFAQDSLGLPNEFFGDFLVNSKTEYNF
ncbi:hypothetical protein LQZ24_00895 [Fructobacillus sp. M1-13]|uniref:Uncharacterized protein n=1 Tax=Fructobacillus papyriferae TaxID=2713171 RepID=A0ABS5QQ33_9LACO|nr:hypothetical protein [Fructobacillus papyriferae]MBS9334595.1 hypothetical protein [Fructobacillus papyriferae]MCD2158584.1 hypothetical protein [Fructobacillus papyriferae]